MTGSSQRRDQQAKLSGRFSRGDVFRLTRTLRIRAGSGALALSLLSTLTACSRETKPVQPESLESAVLQPRTGDLDGMVKAGRIRALVVYSKTAFFYDQGEPRGYSYDDLQEFETFVNRKLGRDKFKVRVVAIPVRRDQLIPALVEGRGDVVAIPVDITEERSREIDFSVPFRANVTTIVVTGPAAKPIANSGDLAGRTIYARKSGSNYENLVRLSEQLEHEGKTPIRILAADENLEDEDLLEMVNAGVIGSTVTETYKADFWSKILTHLVPRPDLVVHEEGDMAWAMRKDSPTLRALVNEFMQGHRAGTAFGNEILDRYLRNTKYVKNVTSQTELAKFRNTFQIFKKYSDQYGFDWVLLAAQGYQESGLDQRLRSPKGAVGIMQVLPSTAASSPVEIVDIHTIDGNVHAAAKLMRSMLDGYFPDSTIDPMNKQLMAVASYNAGPARIARLRGRAAEKGLNPNKWFGNVELVAAEDIGRETVQYVSNVYKYYVQYKLVLEDLQSKQAAALKQRR